MQAQDMLTTSIVVVKAGSRLRMAIRGFGDDELN